MHILALQPYDTGSHRALLEGWQRNSRHSFTTLTLPGRHFKWRFRQAPVAFAKEIKMLTNQGETWDALWCTSMLDLAALRGLSPPVGALPGAAYFHENQLTYPVRYEKQRDLHFGLTNMTTALAAIASAQHSDAPCVWWNSGYNRDSFLDALQTTLAQMPDHAPLHVIETIRDRSALMYPGIDPIAPSALNSSVPPHLLWAARWEYDKGPELFFEALDDLAKRGMEFRLSVIGEQFAEAPACFKSAKSRFADRVVHWGYQQGRESYETVLREADIVVSTSKHEFFGLAVAEAVSAGCIPVVPNALAYPEVWADQAVYHDATPAGVADAIERGAALHCTSERIASANRFVWSCVATQFDDAIESLAE